MTGRFWGPQRDTGAQDGGWVFRIWAPSAGAVSLRLADRSWPMRRDPDGRWQVRVPARPGQTYRLHIDGEDVPDPASRLQADGLDGPSVLSDLTPPRPWAGRPWHEAAICQLHVGCFTPEGTFAAAAERLPGLAALGLTAIQLMPVGQFAGDRGWGYDGVQPFAPHPAYGRPEDLRQLVQTAHDCGMMVILDLVMNHFGPEGAWMHRVAPAFFDADRHTPWGAAIDFDQPAVHDYWMACAMHWLEDYGIDGLRLDAVHQMRGPGARTFLVDLAARAAQLTPARHLITEDERNIPDLREAGHDAALNDDFHHAVHVALTRETDGYYAPFADDPVGDLALALSRGHVLEGQDRPGGPPRGAPCGHLPPTAFVNAIQTHDQIGNRAFGDRLLTLADPQAVRVAYGLLLAAPFIPMIFMGEERGETAPFQFFADFHGDLAQAVRQGRAAEFPDIARRGDAVPDPIDPATMKRSRLSWADDARARDWMALTRRALAFRAAHVVPLLAGGSPETSVTREGPGLIRALWQFPGGALALSLALGQPDPTPLPDPDLAVGDPDGPFSLTMKALP